jgi:hypothetical protein
VTVSGLGESEVAALRNLGDHLRGVAGPLGTRMDDLRRRLRFAFLEGAEDESRRSVGRGLTPEEQDRVLRRYSGG